MLTQSPQYFSDLLIEWDDLQQKLVTNNLANVSSKLTTNTGLIEEISKDIETKKASIQQMETKINKNHKDIEQMKTATLKSFKAKFMGNHKKELEKEETEFITACRNLQTEQHELEYLKNELEKLKKEYAQLEADKKLVNSMIDRVQQIESTIFDGPTPSCPSEDQLEQETLTLQQKTTAMRSTLNRHNSALTLIQEAVASCRKSVDALIQAKDKATTDLFFNSTILDILKHRNLNTAEREMEIVKYKLQSAISIYPEIRNYLPQHELLMDTTKPNSIVDSLFDNVVSDYYIREQIQKSLDTILSTTNSLTLCKNNLQKDPDQMKSQYGQIQTDYMNAWKNLKEYRREIMLGWIQTEKDIINGDSPPEYSD